MDLGDLIIIVLHSGIETGTVLLFATIGEILTERSGVLNLGVEGMMLMGAMSAFSVAASVRRSQIFAVPQFAVLPDAHSRQTLTVVCPLVSVAQTPLAHSLSFAQVLVLAIRHVPGAVPTQLASALAQTLYWSVQALPVAIFGRQVLLFAAPTQEPLTQCASSVQVASVLASEQCW